VEPSTKAAAESLTYAASADRRKQPACRGSVSSSNVAPCSPSRSLVDAAGVDKSSPTHAKRYPARML